MNDSTNISPLRLACSCCGAEVPIEAESEITRCAYCEASLYIDASQTVMHFVLPVAVGRDKLASCLGRKLASLEIASPIEVQTAELALYPFWRRETALGKGFAFAAAAPPAADLVELEMPLAEKHYFTLATVHGDVEVIAPRVALNHAAPSAAQADRAPGEASKPALIHAPFYRVAYDCQNTRYTAVVDAVNGEVYADDWPAPTSSARDRALGAIAALAFALFAAQAAILPSFGWLVGAYALTALLIYFFARYSLRRIGW